MIARRAFIAGLVALPLASRAQQGSRMPRVGYLFSFPRSEAGVVVTEKGAADLRGCSLRERERRMRAISRS